MEHKSSHSSLNRLNSVGIVNGSCWLPPLIDVIGGWWRTQITDKPSGIQNNEKVMLDINVAQVSCWRGNDFISNGCIICRCN